jgi:RNA-directed DNA polymerase
MRLDLNPYEQEHKEYFEKKRQTMLLSRFKDKLLKKYEYTCDVCRESLKGVERIELHHIKPVAQGGKTTLSNMMPLHKICHQQITYRDKDIEPKK